MRAQPNFEQKTRRAATGLMPKTGEKYVWIGWWVLRKQQNIGSIKATLQFLSSDHSLIEGACGVLLQDAKR